jgi:hypothetical protein
MTQLSTKKYRTAREAIEAYIPDFTPPTVPPQTGPGDDQPPAESAADYVDELLRPLKKKLEQLKLPGAC